MEYYQSIIAIDGPAGAGKSTVSKMIAANLGFTYLDTGAMYRAITWLILENNLNSSVHQAEIINLLESLDLQIKEGVVIVNGQIVTSQIREPRVSRAVSEISAIAKVREHLLRLQQKIGKQGKIILDGRDIGTTVFPEAGLKIFLQASSSERARRRQQQQMSTGIQQDLEEVQKEIEHRDQLDYNRQVSPLKQAEDAILLNTDNLDITQVVAKITKLAKDKLVF